MKYGLVEIEWPSLREGGLKLPFKWPIRCGICKSASAFRSQCEDVLPPDGIISVYSWAGKSVGFFAICSGVNIELKNALRASIDILECLYSQLV